MPQSSKLLRDEILEIEKNMRNLVDRINWTPIAPGYAEYLYEIEALRRNINFIKQEIYKELRDQENETATKEAILR